MRSHDRRTLLVDEHRAQRSEIHGFLLDIRPNIGFSIHDALLNSIQILIPLMLSAELLP